jgi:hypothetical protein
MPVFNREEFVDEAIQSVIAQDFGDFELLIVDDGSTDRTPELLRAWAARDARVVVITSPENIGIAAAANLGLRYARSECVARLDSDDVMMPGRLAAQAALLDSHPEVVLVSSCYETMDRDGRYLGTWDVVEPHEVVTWLLHFYNIVGGGGHVMFRKSQVLALGGYDVGYPASEDYDLWVRLLRTGRILTLPLIGMKQRDHRGRATVAYAGIKRANWTTIMRTMREAFARFCREYPDPDLRRRLRKRTARGWMEGAQSFADAGQRAEAMRFMWRAIRWSPAAVIEYLRRRLG